MPTATHYNQKSNRVTTSYFQSLDIQELYWNLPVLDTAARTGTSIFTFTDNTTVVHRQGPNLRINGVGFTPRTSVPDQLFERSGVLHRLLLEHKLGSAYIGHIVARIVRSLRRNSSRRPTIQHGR